MIRDRSFSRLRGCIPWLLGGLLATGAYAQGSAVKFPQPAARDLTRAGLVPQDGGQTWKAAELGKIMDSAQDAPIIREIGFRGLRTNRLISPFGNIVLETYALKDNKAVYSLFLHWRPVNSKSLEIGEACALSPGQLLFRQFEYLIRLRFNTVRPEAEKAAIAVAESVSRVIGERQEAPSLSQFLPAAGRHLPSERYYLGMKGLQTAVPEITEDCIGFADHAEVAYSEYHLGGKKGRLLLIGYPTTALAKQYSETLASAFEKLKLTENGFFTKRSGAFNAVLLGNVPADEARQLLDKIEYSYTVKWIYRKDEEAPSAATAESLSLLTTVVASILLTGLFSLASVVGGILLGGSRFLLRTFVPNNFLDRPERTALLRLNIFRS